MEDEKDAAAHEQQKSRTDKIVELLRDSEKSAGELVTALGLEQSNVSQHLARLREKHILIARKQGIGVFYSVRDPKLFQVLDLLPEYFYEHLGEIQQIMRQL
jgi:ArsR family transcriptional regulator